MLTEHAGRVWVAQLTFHLPRTRKEQLCLLFCCLCAARWQLKSNAFLTKMFLLSLIYKSRALAPCCFFGGLFELKSFMCLSSAKGLVASLSSPWLLALCWCTTAALVADRPPHQRHHCHLTALVNLLKPRKSQRDHRESHHQHWRGTQVSWIIR